LRARVDHFNAGEVLRVVGHDNAVVGFRDGGNDGVECAARAAAGGTGGHPPPPCQRGLLLEREDAPGEQRRRALRPRKPLLESVTFATRGLLQHTAPDLGDGE